MPPSCGREVISISTRRESGSRTPTLSAFREPDSLSAFAGSCVDRRSRSGVVSVEYLRYAVGWGPNPTLFQSDSSDSQWLIFCPARSVTLASDIVHLYLC